MKGKGEYSTFATSGYFARTRLWTQNNLTFLINATKAQNHESRIGERVVGSTYKLRYQESLTGSFGHPFTISPGIAVANVLVIYNDSANN